MNTVAFPADYQQVMPYLILQDIEGFIAFATEVLGATEKMKHLNDEGFIQHCELFFGKAVVMIGRASDEWKQENAGMFIYVTDVDACYQVAIDKGARSVMTPADQDYGRSCGIRDAFGNTWWITSEL